jgi:hypothetical protein
MSVSRATVRLSLGLGVSFASLLGSGCSAGTLPAVSGTRESGQSRLMDQTFAGQNACNPKNHLRPFVIEWDGTDMSSFEAYASSDLVVVRYEGCALTVLDGCRDDSVRGSLGAYRAVDWTSGSLETIDIGSDADLYAKLPLGAATLEGRVKAGEKFHMEYYVAGTKTATRDAVYSEDLAKIPRCKGGTHFVYGYNLGAFALGSVSNLEGTANGSLYGFGGSVQKTNTRSAEKKGGQLSACKSSSATEVEGCKSPIRLTLRPIEQGANPDAAAAKAPESDASLNKAGKVEARLDMSDQARAHYDSAQAKLNVRDGKGCIQELDAHDQLDAKNKSTDPKSTTSMIRAQCLMLSGKCEAGKLLARKQLEQSAASLSAAEGQDDTVEALASTFCQGGDTSSRDQLLGAINTLQRASSPGGSRDKAVCQSALGTFRRLAGKVKPKDDTDIMLQEDTFNAVRYAMIPGCFARAGDCDTAYKLFVELNGSRFGVDKSTTPEQKARILDTGFNNSIRSNAPTCLRGEQKDKK